MPPRASTHTALTSRDLIRTPGYLTPSLNPPVLPPQPSYPIAQPTLSTPPLFNLEPCAHLLRTHHPHPANRQLPRSSIMGSPGGLSGQHRHSANWEDIVVTQRTKRTTSSPSGLSGTMSSSCRLSGQKLSPSGLSGKKFSPSKLSGQKM